VCAEGKEEKNTNRGAGPGTRRTRPPRRCGSYSVSLMSRPCPSGLHVLEREPLPIASARRNRSHPRQCLRPSLKSLRERWVASHATCSTHRPSARERAEASPRGTARTIAAGGPLVVSSRPHAIYDHGSGYPAGRVGVHFSRSRNWSAERDPASGRKVSTSRAPAARVRP